MRQLKRSIALQRLFILIYPFRIKISSANFYNKMAVLQIVILLILGRCSTTLFYCIIYIQIYMPPSFRCSSNAHFCYSATVVWLHPVVFSTAWIRYTIQKTVTEDICILWFQRLHFQAIDESTALNHIKHRLIC